MHIFATWRDRRNAQRARRIEHLVSAYQRLIEASQRDSLTPDQAKNVEDAVSDVLLLGQRAEVEAASAFIENWALRGSTDMKPLLTALRASPTRGAIVKCDVSGSPWGPSGGACLEAE